MHINPRRQQILQQMNSITLMERGKLSAQQAPGGGTAFHKLQHWRNGKNHTRYIPAEQVPAVEQALAGHQEFQALAEEFVDLTVLATRQHIQADAKKNSMRSKPTATRKQKLS